MNNVGRLARKQLHSVLETAFRMQEESCHEAAGH